MLQARCALINLVRYQSMSWARILENDAGPVQPLRQRIVALLDQQRQAWPMFRAGEAALNELRTKTLTSGNDFVVVQLNPARLSSVLASTDPESIATRACLLCPDNMPLEERGVAFGDLVVLPNPFPCLPQHCTIASREHTPQGIGGRLEECLQLSQALGPELAVTYNGPRCGASAPDHFHFQCVQADSLPILCQLPLPALRASAGLHSNFGRNMYLFAGPEVAPVLVEVERTIGMVGRRAASSVEAMINLAAHFNGDFFTMLIFPRARHRPACYFAGGPERLVVSPGVLEMCGHFIVTDAADFDRIDAERVRLIYAEVCAQI